MFLTVLLLFLALAAKNGIEKYTTIIIEKCTILPKMLQIASLFSATLPLLPCFLPIFEILIVQKLQFFAAFCRYFCYFCPMKKKINYNPALTIAENAQKNGVTEDAIRYYIKTHNINRRKEAAVRIINACRKVLVEQPDLSPYKVAQEIGASVNTVKKYWDLIVGEREVELSNTGNKKRQKLTLRQKHNFYATHPSCTSDILREETFCNFILEPFCGTGSMAEAIKKAGYEVDAYDIVDRGYGKVSDFQELEVEKGKFDIISNPPYDSHLVAHILKCIDICHGKVALLLPLLYLSSKTRYDLLYSKFPPKRVYVYKERIGIAINADFERFADAGANMTIYAWFIWERGFQGITELHWISNLKEK